MKKGLIITIIALVIMSSFSAVLAIAFDGKVEGTAFYSDDMKGVSRADVLAVCSGNTKVTTADSLGNFILPFTAEECPEGALVTVTATKGRYAGSSSAVMAPGIEINVAAIDVEVDYVQKAYKQNVDRLYWDQEVTAGDYLEVNVNVNNQGEEDLKAVKVTIVVPELGLRKRVSLEKIESDDEDTLRTLLEVPEDTPAGEYLVRITTSNDQVRTVKHRYIEIV